MKLILTSFGLSHLRRREEDNPDLFWRMPPVSLSQLNREFMPDYAALLLSDQIIVDEKTYHRLITGRHWSYGTMALMIKMLHDEGFVHLEDFDAIVNKNKPLLEEILGRDLKELDLWVPPLKESCQTWRQFMETMHYSLRDEIARSRLGEDGADPEMLMVYQSQHHHTAAWLHEFGHYTMSSFHLVEEAMDSATKRRKSEYREALKRELAEYLAYVNANLLLCDAFECGFHDWHDFAPFYREKFMRVAKDGAPGQTHVENVKRLFDVSFPEFTFWDPDNVLRALKDRRIVELRDLVDKAAKGEVTFDREFAMRVLQEVLNIERGLGTLRNMVSYVTLPLGFIPVWGTAIQKAAEEAIARPLASMKQKGFRWFYLISELAQRHQKSEIK